MPWTIDNPPPPAKNWTLAEKKKCVPAANATLENGGTEEEAVFACIRAAGKSRRGERMTIGVIDKLATAIMKLTQGSGDSVQELSDVWGDMSVTEIYQHILNDNIDTKERFYIPFAKAADDVLIFPFGPFYRHGQAREFTREDGKLLVRNFKNNVIGRLPPVNAEHMHQYGRIAYVADAWLSEDGVRGRLREAEGSEGELAKFDYLSPEIKWEWTHPYTGKTHKNVLFGMGATNYPFFLGKMAIHDSAPVRMWTEKGWEEYGGPGSGHHGHKGVPGQRGGSVARGVVAVGGVGKPTVSEALSKATVVDSDLDWRSEDTITGTVTIDSEQDLSGLSESEASAYLTQNVNDEHVRGITGPQDIEEIKITNIDTAGTYATIEVDITPTVEAGDRWAEGVGGEEEWLLYHGQYTDAGGVAFSHAVEFATTDDAQRIAYGVVMRPNEPDAQGHVTGPADVERACHLFMERALGLDAHHARLVQSDEARIVECWIQREPARWTMTLPDGTERATELLPGDWCLGVKFYSNELWAEVQSGEIAGFSPAGWGVVEKKPLKLDTS